MQRNKSTSAWSPKRRYLNFGTSPNASITWPYSLVGGFFVSPRNCCNLETTESSRKGALCQVHQLRAIKGAHAHTHTLQNKAVKLYPEHSLFPAADVVLFMLISNFCIKQCKINPLIQKTRIYLLTTYRPQCVCVWMSHEQTQLLSWKACALLTKKATNRQHLSSLIRLCNAWGALFKLVFSFTAHAACINTQWSLWGGAGFCWLIKVLSSRFIPFLSL